MYQLVNKRQATQPLFKGYALKYKILMRDEKVPTEYGDSYFG
jgi:hypothetical protein